MERINRPERVNSDTSVQSNSTFRRLTFRKKDRASRAPYHTSRVDSNPHLNSRSLHEVELSNARPTSPGSLNPQAGSVTEESALYQLQQRIIKLRSHPKQNVDDVFNDYKQQSQESAELCRRLLQNQRRNTTSIDSRNTISLYGISSSSSSHDFDTRLRIVRDYIGYQEILLDTIRTALSKTYRNYEPNATDSQIEALFINREFRDSAFTQMRSASMHRITSDPPLLRALYQIRFRNYERVQKDIADIKRLFQSPTANLTSSYDITIAENGDTILEFNSNGPAYPVLRFRVLSHVLREVSPLFAQMLSDTVSSNSKLDLPSPDMYTHCMLSVLPPPPVTQSLRNGTSVKVYRMPQIELDKHHSLTILLQAAHLHRKEVPQDISFDEFVSIAEVCLKYRCTSPVQDRVEYLWLPKWNHKAVDEMPDGFLLICYVFGDEQLFSRVSKSAILNIKDEDDVCALWPAEVRDKIKTIRKAKLEQVQNCCMMAISEYLPKPTQNRVRRSIVGELHFSSGPKCPKGDVTCDFQTLGWLLSVFNELGIPIMKSDDPAELPRRSLKELMDRLRSMRSTPVKEGHGDVCDYAPGFRKAIDDLYNSIIGLNLRDIGGRESWPVSRYSYVMSVAEQQFDGIPTSLFSGNGGEAEEVSGNLPYNNESIRAEMNTTPSPNPHFDISGSESQSHTPASSDDAENAHERLSQMITQEEIDRILYSGESSEPCAPSSPQVPLARMTSWVSRSTWPSSDDAGVGGSEKVLAKNDKMVLQVENKHLGRRVDQSRGIVD